LKSVHSTWLPAAIKWQSENCKSTSLVIAPLHPSSVYLSNDASCVSPLSHRTCSKPFFGCPCHPTMIGCFASNTLILCLFATASWNSCLVKILC
jgi:hypothetical protein